MPLQRNSRILLALALAGGLSGCADYMNHRDSVTLGAGNALEGNIGLHTIDPFPADAYDTDIDRDGDQVIKKKILVAPAAPAVPAAS